MRPAMEAIWADVRDDPDVRVVIVTGAGDRHFCTGLDLRDTAATGQTTTGMGRAEDEMAWSPLHNGVWKPVICALNGLVAGGGLHFVADADIVLAASHAAIMDTHTSVGMVGAVENVGLAHRMPLGSALRLTMMGRAYRMSAERAHQLGLVDEIYPPGELQAGALDMAAAIARNSPAAVSLSKQAIWGSIGKTAADAAEYAWALARMHRAHPDFREGPRAFVERRDPRWTAE
jgi:enoyl-CoA hydratase/carnithine racemase